VTTVARWRADRQQLAAVAPQLLALALIRPGPAGWAAGLAYAAGLWLLLRAACRRHGVTTLGPAGVVTLLRAALVGTVTALVADRLARVAPPLVADGPAGSAAASAGSTPALLTVIASVALLLDAVDGRVARRTGTATALGARFDMEVDAFLILVLSVHVADRLGAWVIAIGALRYAFVALSWAVPWLRGGAPARNSARVVAAAAGIVLVAAGSGGLPQLLALALVAGVLVALLWSFGQDVRVLWRVGHPGRPLPMLAVVLVTAALLVPHRPAEFTPAALARIPLEGLLGLALLTLLPARSRRPAAVVFGALLGVATVVTLLNAGFLAAQARPFHPVIDWMLFDDALGFVRSSAGTVAWVIAAVLIAAAAIGLPALLVRSAVRLADFVGAHRRAALRTVAAATVVWLACAATGAHLVDGVPIADAGTTALARDLAIQVDVDLRDRDSFAGTVGIDPFRDAPQATQLRGLRGKDVVLAFVEGYGRSAVSDPTFAAQVDPVLDVGTRELAAAGFAARSAWLTSPTFGGGSWLAHSTLNSGLWINSQDRYHELVTGDRLTLNRAFSGAGWRSVAVLPGLTSDWPEQNFYGFDQVYDSRQLGYRGPAFSFAPMPDQFTLEALQRFERGRPGRGPLYAQVVLISSHAPWTPLPRMVGWDQLGDGSVFAPMAGPNLPTDVIFSRNPDQVRADYRTSISYSLRSLIDYVRRYGDDNLVLVFLGDHQPAPLVVGADASRDVPVTVLARDRAVLDRISAWGWSPGLRPAADAPVWRMDAFRDRFLTTFATPAGAPGWRLSASGR
jgi:phosphatidylglycerophosphate synthase